MKKLACLTFILVFTLAGPVLAQDQFLKKDKTVYLGRQEVVGGDYFAQGKNIFILGKIDGDAYLFGENIIIDGEIDGDLIVFGGKVTVNGTVLGNLRGVTFLTQIDGQIRKNISMISGGLTLSKKAHIAGNLNFAGGNLEILGTVGKNLQAWGRRTIISGSIFQDSNIWSPSLLITETSTISGNLNYTSQTTVELQNGASVSGKIVHKDPGGRHLQKLNKENIFRVFLGVVGGFGGFLRILSLVISLILGVIFIKFFPKFTVIVVKNFSAAPGNSFFIGFLALLISPLIFATFIITIVGIPLAFIFLILVMLAVYFAKIFVSLALGIKVAKNIGKPEWRIKALVIGLLLYHFLTIVPKIGIFMAIILGIAGFGAIITSQIDYYQSLSRKKWI